MTALLATLVVAGGSAVADEIVCDPATEACPVEITNVIPAGNQRLDGGDRWSIAPGDALGWTGTIQSAQGWVLDRVDLHYHDGSGAFVSSVPVTTETTVSGSNVSGEGLIAGSGPNCTTACRELVRVRIRAKKDFDTFEMFTDFVEIDESRPTILKYIVDGPRTIKVTFTENVFAPGGNSRLDWRVNPDPNDTFEFRPTSVEPESGSERILTTPFDIAPDATPFVRYNPEQEENVSDTLLRDGAQNRLAPSNRNRRAVDEQPPLPPRIDTINGQAVGSGVLGNQRRPTLTASGVPSGNWIEFWRDNGDGEPDVSSGSSDIRLGEAQVSAGSASFQVPSNLAGGAAVEYKFFVRARDNALCDPNTPGSVQCPNFSDPPFHVARYTLDTVAPRAVRASTNGSVIVVRFDEAVIGGNTAADWSVSSGGPVTGVSGTGLTRTLNAAAVPIGGTVTYTKPETGVAAADAAGNDVLGFPLLISDGVDVIIEPASLVESGGNMTFRVSISAPPPQDVTVNWVTEAGTATVASDYQGSGGSVFFPKDDGTTRSALVTLFDDLEDEPDETFRVRLTSALNAVIAVPQATGTIVDDDDPPSLSIGDVAVDEGDEGKVNAVFPVTVSVPSGQAVSASYSLVGDTAIVGSDVDAASGTVTIPAGQTSASITTKVRGDAVYEDDEKFRVVLSQPSNAQLGDGIGVGTILNDDDVPRMTIDDTDVVELDTTESRAQVTVRLDAISGATTRVRYTTEPGSATADVDYRTVTGTLTLPPGATEGQVSVDVLPDDVEEQDEDLAVVLSDAIGAAIDDDAGTVTIIDNDGPVDEDRNAGDDRIDTSVETSRDTFPGTTEHVVLARADAYPDALAGGPLAVQLYAPILLTDQEALHPRVRSEIQRLDARTVYLLGGTSALSITVENELLAMGLEIVRLGGIDRFATARLIAEAMETGTSAYLTEGIDANPNRGWPDAVAVSALAAFQGRPILLTRTDSVPPETMQALRDLDIESVTIVGGAVAVSAGVEVSVASQGITVERIAGETRYDTSRLIGERSVEAGMEPRALWLATGRDWPDSLTAGPATVIQGKGVLVLIDGLFGFDRSPEIREFVTRYGEHVLRLVLVGGLAAITPSVATAVRDLLNA